MLLQRGRLAVGRAASSSALASRRRVSARAVDVLDPLEVPRRLPDVSLQEVLRTEQRYGNDPTRLPNLARSVQDLLQIHQQYRHNMGVSAVSHLWVTLRRLGHKEKQWLRTVDFAKASQPLRDHTERLLKENKLDGRGLSNVMHALASAELTRGPWATLWRASLPAVLSRLDKLNEQQLSNVTWAYCKSEQDSPELLAGITAQIESRGTSGFKPVELSALAWSFARAGHAPASLFEALAAEAEEQLHLFGPVEISNTAWAHARAGYGPGCTSKPSKRLMAALAAATVAQADSFSLTPIAMVAWAYARVGAPYPPGLYDAIGARAIVKPNKAKGGDIANLLWSFAVAGAVHGPMFDALALVVAKKASTLELMQMSMICWAYAEAGHRSSATEEMLRALTEMATARGLGGMTTQGLANVAWALAKLDVAAPALFSEIREQAVRRAPEFNPQELANLCWAFSVMREQSDVLLHSIQGAAVPQLRRFRPKELSALIWAFAHARHTDPALFGLLADEVHARLDDGPQFDWRETSSLANSFALAARSYGASAVPGVEAVVARCFALCGRRAPGQEDWAMLSGGAYWGPGRLPGSLRTAEWSGGDERLRLEEAERRRVRQAQGPLLEEDMFPLERGLDPSAPGYFAPGAVLERSKEAREQPPSERPAILLLVEELTRSGLISASSFTPAALAAQENSAEEEEEELLRAAAGGLIREGDATLVERSLAGAVAEVRSAEAAVKQGAGRLAAAREAARLAEEAARAAGEAARREELRLAAAQAAARVAAAEYAEWTVRQARLATVATSRRGGAASAGSSSRADARGGGALAEAAGQGGAEGGSAPHPLVVKRRSWEFLMRTLVQAAQPEHVKAIVQTWAPIDAGRRRADEDGERGASVGGEGGPREGGGADRSRGSCGDPGG